MTYYCYKCGNELVYGLIHDDDFLRNHCKDCGYIHYENPKIQTTVVVQNGGKMLWMKRATEPGIGRWALPGGYMEVGESPREAAARELREETGLVLDPSSLRFYLLGNLNSMNQVHILFHAVCSNPDTQSGDEALAVDWFAEDEAPWGELAFPNGEPGLRLFYRDIICGKLGIYYSELGENELYLNNFLE